MARCPFFVFSGLWVYDVIWNLEKKTIMALYDDETFFGGYELSID